MQTNERWTLKWAHGEATVQAIGAMLAPVRFELGAGRSVSPLHVAPWGDDPRYPGLMRALRGEWPCLPFGTIDAPPGLPEGFTTKTAGDEWRHGFSSNHMWQLVEQTAHTLRLRIDYPAESEVESLERLIEADPHGPSLSVSLMVRVRRDVTLPFALHPTFAMPQEGLEVVACPYRAVHTYPVAIEPDYSQILTNRACASLAELPTRDGSFDVTHLPLPQRTEELVQLEACRPPFVLRYPADRAEVSLDWNTDDFPDAVMWISNGGRDYEPWSQRNFALGVEPVRGFFDLGRVVTPPPDHPLADRVGQSFEAGKPHTIRYRLSATAL
ncbi:hypothetical protein [Paraburkholderia sp. DHOC27]|uniref:hypothetical protein n=1 Tax=Paraburkholderia sp. DHOC27 TaxID=2303330 RepID=UPI000E3BA031|nr:hypothetical protein [Paraburkholderia sp. DHOC27]RFU49753.1 hypothetical protein D0B32_08270 [Paraburkholderia sp. DHOC27]